MTSGLPLLVVASLVAGAGSVFAAKSSQNAAPPLQRVTISPIGTKVYGDAPFQVTASSSSGLPVGLSVSGPAELTGNTVAITGAGEVVITARQIGNVSFSPVSQKLTLRVLQATLVATANNQTREQGQANPELTISYSGFVGSDDKSVLDQVPVASTKATLSSRPGNYAISVSPGRDNNYRIVAISGTLTVLSPGIGSYSGGSLTVNGSGSVVVSGNNSYGSGATINAGTLQISPTTVTSQPGSSLLYTGVLTNLVSLASATSVPSGSILRLGSAPYVTFGPGTYLVNGIYSVIVAEGGSIEAGVGVTVAPFTP